MLLSTYFDGDVEHAWEAVFRMCGLFENTARFVGEKLGWEYNEKKERGRGSFWNGRSRWRNSFCVSLGSIMHGCLGTEYYIYEFFIKRNRQQEGLGTVFLCEIESYVKTIGEIIYSCRPSGMFPHTHSIQRTDFRNWRDMSLWQKRLIKTTSPSLLPMS